jgi:hypothetical protein
MLIEAGHNIIPLGLYAMLGTLFFCYTGVDVADHFATCT